MAQGKIKSIKAMDKTYEVGNWIDLRDCREIAEIKDETLEYPDSIHLKYGCYDKEGNQLVAIEDCGVVVVFDPPEKSVVSP